MMETGSEKSVRAAAGATIGRTIGLASRRRVPSGGSTGRPNLLFFRSGFVSLNAGLCLVVFLFLFLLLAVSLAFFVSPLLLVLSFLS